MTNDQTIHIIGGGIIGLTSAWYLLDEGYKVTVIDKSDYSDGTSHGNAGMIVPSHFVPMTTPGVISQGLKWMFDKKSPFYVKPRLNLDLMQWLWKFYRSCNQDHVDRCMPILYDYNEWSKTLYRDFAKDERFAFSFQEVGLLMLYRSKHQEKEEVELAEKANSLGIAANVLSGTELTQLEPNIKLDALGGVHFPGDAHLYPNRFINQLRKELGNRGAQFLSGTEVVDFGTSNGKIKSLKLQDNTRIVISNLVIASGSWTPFILKKLGIKILLQDGKGYSITLNNPNKKPSIPTILTEAKVALTPMGNDLRIGGTLELGGLSSKIQKSRLDGILNSVPKYYPEIKPTPQNAGTVWMGYRPCSADGMPFLGRSTEFNNLIVASGHGMMGMSMGPATGKIVSEIASGKVPSIDLSLMSINR